MPGVYRLGWQHGLVDAVAEARSYGVNQVVIFPKVGAEGLGRVGVGCYSVACGRSGGAELEVDGKDSAGGWVRWALSYGLGVLSVHKSWLCAFLVSSPADT